jgi:hypothetical protein
MTRPKDHEIGVVTGSTRFLTRFFISVGVLAALAQPVNAQAPTFQGLGQMPGTMPGAGTECNGVSGDGKVVIGYTWTGSSSTAPFR